MRVTAFTVALMACATSVGAQQYEGTIAWILERSDQTFDIHDLGEVTFKDRILVGDPTLLDGGWYFPTHILDAPSTARYITMTESQFGDMAKAVLLFSDMEPTCGVSYGRTEEIPAGVFMDPDRIRALQGLAQEAAKSPDLTWTELGLWPQLSKSDNWSAIVTLNDGVQIPAYSNWDSGYYPVYAFYDKDLTLAAIVMDHYPTSRGEIDMPPACQ